MWTAKGRRRTETSGLRRRPTKSWPRIPRSGRPGARGQRTRLPPALRPWRVGARPVGTWRIGTRTGRPVARRSRRMWSSMMWPRMRTRIWSRRPSAGHRAMAAGAVTRGACWFATRRHHRLLRLLRLGGTARTLRSGRALFGRTLIATGGSRGLFAGGFGWFGGSAIGGRRNGEYFLATRAASAFAGQFVFDLERRLAVLAGHRDRHGLRSCAVVSASPSTVETMSRQRGGTCATCPASGLPGRIDWRAINVAQPARFCPLQPEREVPTKPMSGRVDVLPRRG